MTSDKSVCVWVGVCVFQCVIKGQKDKSRRMRRCVGGVLRERR